MSKQKQPGSLVLKVLLSCFLFLICVVVSPVAVEAKAPNDDWDTCIQNGGNPLECLPDEEKVDICGNTHYAKSQDGQCDGMSQIYYEQETYEPLYPYIKKSDAGASLIRSIGYWLVDLLGNFVDALYTIALNIVTLGQTYILDRETNSDFQDIYYWVMFIALSLLPIFLIIRGVKVWMATNDKGPKELKDLTKSILIGSVFLIGISLLFVQGVSFTGSAFGLMTSGLETKSPKDKILKASLIDIEYVRDVLQSGGTMESLNDEYNNLTEKEMEYFEINEPAKYEIGTNSGGYEFNRVIISYHDRQQDYVVGKINYTGLFSLGSEYIYKWYMDIFYVLASFIIITIALAFYCIKVPRIYLELGFSRLVAPIVAMSDIGFGGRMKEFAKHIGSNFALIWVMGLALVFYFNYTAWVSTATGSIGALNFNDTVTKLAFQFAGMLFMLDGSKLVTKLLGVDAGVQDGSTAIMQAAAAGRMAGGVVGGIKGAAGAAMHAAGQFVTNPVMKQVGKFDAKQDAKNGNPTEPMENAKNKRSFLGGSQQSYSDGYNAELMKHQQEEAKNSHGFGNVEGQTIPKKDNQNK
ncbi:pLS20_p028 family conjugation system transmembrane protein [Culicoidibacter larvae]|uniref:DUF8208 domain-containing protein n=1 Tax=Culicoidibacter larvae TaxID=2579976 RepID=A0A5R8Q973_9FIRM|nr:hypothetical protein [Culicoidibacter larvae]TLG71158.1 hypothetical protein FEZ08_11430 [Culicoidibacter larvae]